MCEIHNILVFYSTKHYFDVENLPALLERIRQDEDMKAVTKSLQERYFTISGKNSICLLR